MIVEKKHNNSLLTATRNVRHDKEADSEYMLCVVSGPSKTFCYYESLSDNPKVQVYPDSTITIIETGEEIGEYNNEVSFVIDSVEHQKIQHFKIKMSELDRMCWLEVKGDP